MGRFIKRFCGVVFGVGGLLFIFPIFSADLEAGPKIVSGLIFLICVFISLAFWGSTLSEDVKNSPNSQALPVAAAISSKIETDKDRIKLLKKAKRYFTYQKHLAGIPQTKRKVRMDIALEDSGISFYEPISTAKVFTLPWNSLIAIETTDSQASNDEAMNNALRVAGYSSSKVSLGGALLLEGALSMMTKTPLIIKFRINREDEFISSIIFDTSENEIIAERINSVRNEIFSAGSFESVKGVEYFSEFDAFIDKIERLAKLREAGHITEHEFELQKRKIAGTL